MIARKNLRWFAPALAFVIAVVAGMQVLVPALAQTSSKSPAESSPEADAIRRSVQSFVAAFEKGDAKALAAHWTEAGEYLSDDGETYRGRAAIEKEYAAAFAKRKGPVKAEAEVDSIRFPSKDTAIEEGHFKVSNGKDLANVGKYTVLHVREEGKWLMALVREWPAAGASLRELDWLIGSWKADREGVEVRTDYEWWKGKNFIRVQFSIKTKENNLSGFQMIGVDAATGGIRSWAFDPDGSFGEATWTRDGKRWMQESASVLADGKTLAATNIFTPIDRDTFLFQSVERSINGEAAPEIAPVRIRRITSK
ncbi:MAG: SgcJ/EcaC family oxidoreductase [Gemmataceae bacterium]